MAHHPALASHATRRPIALALALGLIPAGCNQGAPAESAARAAAAASASAIVASAAVPQEAVVAEQPTLPAAPQPIAIATANPAAMVMVPNGAMTMMPGSAGLRGGGGAADPAAVDDESERSAGGRRARPSAPPPRMAAAATGQAVQGALLRGDLGGSPVGGIGANARLGAPVGPGYGPAASARARVAFGSEGGRGMDGAPEPVAAPANALTAIDANGRFATTYRPGGGNLAAFEASLASGAIPVSARELVGDLGARYAPDLAPPAQGALALRADLERTALPPTGGLLRLRLALRSTETPATARPTMSVHLVLDHSGSMGGRPMEDALAAARQLVQRLAPTDTFSLTSFSSEAEVLVPAGPVGPRRANIIAAIDRIVADGGTNIGEGLRMGYAQAERGPQSPETVKLVLLLSDGRATDGEVQPRVLAGMAAQAFQHSVQTSSFGVGTDYDGPLMSSIAEQGSGGYYYVRDSARIAAALATELDARTQPVAQAVELRVRLRDGVELVQTYGSRRLGEDEAQMVRAQEVALDTQVARRDGIARNRDRDNEGGMRFFIPGFARADSHVVLLGLRLPEGTGERALASVELRYKDRILGRNVTTEVPLRVRYAADDAASLATLDASVARTVQGFDAGETLVRAARDVEHGRRDAAVALLEEREGLLRAASQRLHDPRMIDDAARLGRYRTLLTGGAQQGQMNETLVLALLMDTSARGYMH